MEPTRRASGASGSGSSSSQRPRQRSSSTSSTASAASTVSSITEEDYDLIANAAVPDGFRPGAMMPRNHSARRPVAPESAPLLPPPPTINPSFSKWNHRPSSVAKPPRPHDSLTIRNDGSNGANNNTQTGGNGVPPLRVETPYRGPSNPVHPYGMYPQRTASNATDRSARGNRSSYTGPRGPAHPYTLYSQGTAAAPVEAHPQSIPIGFTGLAAPYERQIGPDGEEVGDLLGPLGHTEELPPYSRYPEVAFATKPGPSPAAAAGAAAETEANAAAAQETPADNSSGSRPRSVAADAPAEPRSTTTDAAPENPFASVEDALVPTSTNSHHSIRSVSTYHDTPSEQILDEKEPRFQTKWQRRARKKLWGVIPYWSICLVFVGMIIMGVVMGAAIGTFLSKNSSKNNKPTTTPELDQNPNPTAVDIQPLETIPVALLPLPVGPFSLPQLDGGRARRNCVNDTSQLAAWSCSMPFHFYSINIIPDNKQPATEHYNLTLSPINLNQSQYIWGTQPPWIKDPIKLKLVNDSMDREGRGPAWWATVSYDKIVVVPEHDLSLAVQKRSWLYTGPKAATVANLERPKLMKQNNQASPGDAIWICIWPETILEILIYPGQNTTVPTATPTGSSSAASSTDTVFGDQDLNMPYDPMSPYPRLVRMLERRTANRGAAKCTKYKIRYHDYQATKVLGPDYKPVEITISENMNNLRTIHRPTRVYDGGDADKFADTDPDNSSLVARDALEFTPCGCLWSQ